MAHRVTIEVDEETAARLTERAKASGKSVAEYLREVTGSGKPMRRPLTVEERRAAMAEWISSRQSRNPDMDDSRESIYACDEEVRLRVIARQARRDGDLQLASMAERTLVGQMQGTMLEDRPL